ncbi:MAG TPA: hypothetical protein DCQ77_13260 [Betaproteobacteria bacterium]|nr:hypothetical protein [Betaproteobacteria bacterium]
MSHQDGMSLRQFAEQTGITEQTLCRYCKAGKVIGARKHPLTKKWWIYPPAKLSMGWTRTPAALKGGMTLSF